MRTKAVVNRMMMYPFILAAVYTAPLFHRSEMLCLLFSGSTSYHAHVHVSRVHCELDFWNFLGSSPCGSSVRLSSPSSCRYAPSCEWSLADCFKKYISLSMCLSIYVSQGCLDAIAYGLAPAIIVRWKHVLLNLYTYMVTGKFVVLTDDSKNRDDGGPGDVEATTPPLFKQYREHSDGLESQHSQHSQHSQLRGECGTEEQEQEQEDKEVVEVDSEEQFEEGLKVYDVYAGLQGDEQNLRQPGVRRGESSRVQTFSATGLTNFYGDDFDY